MQYYKITNFEENHNGFQYKDGLNILDKPFEEKGSCVRNGLYFTTLEHIQKFYCYGVNLREVHLPVDDPEFRMVMDPDGDKYRANKIILGKKYSLFDPETYRIFGLDISQNKYLIDDACSYGRTDVLMWWSKSNILLEYSTSAVDMASANGLIDVLEWWWWASPLELKYTFYAIDLAIRNGHSDVVRWWLNSGFIIKYSEYADRYASENQTELLLLIKEKGLLIDRFAIK